MTPIDVEAPRTTLARAVDAEQCSVFSALRNDLRVQRRIEIFGSTVSNRKKISHHLHL